jgi:hypothetical protein
MVETQLFHQQKHLKWILCDALLVTTSQTLHPHDPKNPR